MESFSEKEKVFYRRLLAIVQSSLPPEDQMRLIAELLNEDVDEPEEKVSSLDWE